MTHIPTFECPECGEERSLPPDADEGVYGCRNGAILEYSADGFDVEVRTLQRAGET